jgi:two-component system, sensor histidine kinase
MTLTGSIRKQLQWLAVVPALIMLLSVLLALTWQRFQDAEQDLISRGNFIARYLASSSEFGFLSGNKDELRQQARFAMQSPDVRVVSYLDNDGVTLMELFVDGDRSRKEPAQLRRFTATVYRQPVLLDARGAESDVSSGSSGASGLQRIGEVSVELSVATIATRQREIIMASIAPAVLALFFGLWIASRLSDRVSKPIHYLSSLVQRIRGGEYQSRGDLNLRGELATLQSDINQLAAEQDRAQREQQLAMDALQDARERAEAASQAKSDFLAMMSHELRTPMNGVLGMLQLLQTTKLERTQEEYATAAVDSTAHLLDVINDILDFSRVESGHLELESFYFRLDDVLQSCVSGFRYVAEKKGLSLELRGVAALANVEVKSDATRVRQIFSNLIGNAIKFTESGYIRIVVSELQRSEKNARLVVRVEDTGIGIAEDKLPDLFNAFMQVDSSTSRRFGGTGLGLAIVSRLMRLLGGDLTVESQIGTGTQFVCTFNLAARTATYPVNEPLNKLEEKVEDSITGKVLLVEDNDVNRMVAEHMLKAIGLDVVSSVNGEEALALLEEQAFGCVLMDVQMPIMDGLTAVSRWREREESSGRERVPIIALTANALSGERERCLQAGMDDYLAKPFQRQKLVGMVRHYLTPKIL